MTNYPPGMTLRPIEHWPGPLTTDRIRSPFHSTWSATMKLLERELSMLSEHLDGWPPPSVLQVAMREQDFRQDRLPRANARPYHPGVILSVETRHGSMSFPCDKFTTWQDNVRAIALALEALRKVERYGITPTDEQYRGWLAIEAADKPVFASADEAERWLREFTCIKPGPMRMVVRQAKAKASPDRHDDDRTLWDKVDAAVQLLEKEGEL